MNKTQFIEALSAHFEGNKKAAGEALDAVIDTITREVSKGEKVALTGFASFEKIVRDARNGRNPATGEKIRIKKKSVPKVTVGADFRNVVSGAKKLPRKTVATATAAARKATTPASKTAAPAARKTTAAATTKKAAPAKKTTSPAKKTTAAKTTTKKAPAKKAPATRAAASKTAATKAPAKKTTAKKTTAKKTTAAKTPAKKTTAKKAPAKKA
ncbi:MAG: HU family DNA-binding protein [Nocardioidaceae bacterium]|nr:HU family DNA-binding protein [Nocardioidaceae bacterium]